MTALPGPTVSPWPPPTSDAPPTAAPGPSTSECGRRYRPPGRLATALTCALVALVGLAAAATAASLANDRLLSRVDDAPTSVTTAELVAADDRSTVLWILVFVSFVATGIVFIAWTRRLYRNLVPLGRMDLRFSEGWAVGAWFVPLLNLVRPKQILDDIWRGDPPGADLQSLVARQPGLTAAPRLVGVVGARAAARRPGTGRRRTRRPPRQSSLGGRLVARRHGVGDPHPPRRPPSQRPPAAVRHGPEAAAHRRGRPGPSRAPVHGHRAHHRAGRQCRLRRGSGGVRRHGTARPRAPGVPNDLQMAPSRRRAVCS